MQQPSCLQGSEEDPGVSWLVEVDSYLEEVGLAAADQPPAS
jgi:hypothetical protein